MRSAALVSRGRGRGGLVNSHNKLSPHNTNRHNQSNNSSNRPRRPAPSFPVISRGGELTTPVSSSKSSVPDRVEHNDSDNEEEDEYAPPAAQSARRPEPNGHTDRNEKNDDEERHLVQRQQVRHKMHQQRQGKQQENRVHAAPSSASSSSATHSAPSNSAASARVQTVLTENDTELPRKLNTKVFIDGLPYSYEPDPGKPSLEEELLEFATAWKVGKALRLIKKNGHGFGFLVFRSPHSVDTAVRVLNGRKFLGRALRVAVPKPRDLENVNDVAGMKDMGKLSHHRQVLLCDLAKIAEPEIIREVLRDVAPQLEKKLETIKMTSRNRKAFLTFGAAEDVTVAVRFLDGFHLLGRKITAIPAAAPGSLPYSHHHRVTSTSLLPFSSAVGVAAAGGNAAPLIPVEARDTFTEEAPTIIPLGTPIMSSAERMQHDRRKAANRDKDNSSKTATSTHTDIKNKSRSMSTAKTALPSSGSSNITGRTDKYNLLDNGAKEVYVGNLTEGTTEEQLRQHFVSCGRVTQCELIVHRDTHIPTGIARVEFALPAYAAFAQQHLHGSRLRGAVLRVDRGATASPALAGEAVMTTSLPSVRHTQQVDDDDSNNTSSRRVTNAARGHTSRTEADTERAAAPRANKRTRSAFKEESVASMQESEASESAMMRKKGRVTLDVQHTTHSRSDKHKQYKHNDDEDEDEEHFGDVDVVTGSTRSRDGSMRARKTKTAKKGGTVTRQHK